MPIDAHAITQFDWPTFQRMMSDYRSGRLGGKPPGKKNFQPGGRPNIRVILLDDLVFGDSVEAAVTEPEPSNEIQRIQFRGSVTGGFWRITFNGEMTGDIAHNANALTVRQALESLSNINPGDVLVFGYEGLWVVEFTGQYAADNVPLMSIINGLSGDAPWAIVTANTIWNDTGRTESVYGMIPTGSPTPMKAGSVALAQWYHGLGYGVHACEPRDFTGGSEAEY